MDSDSTVLPMSVSRIPVGRYAAVPMRLKLLIDTRSNTVVYAEACKRFVDHLFQMLNLPMPLGVFVGLAVGGQVTNGSLGNLVTSIQDLINSRHIVTRKAAFLKPLHPSIIDRFRTCTAGHTVATGSPVCPDCRLCINTTMRHVGAPLVKVGSYMVTDDLVVRPMSTADVAILFNRLSLSEAGVLQERVVDAVIDQDKADRLLHAAFNSKKVLTDVFILGFSSFRWFEFSPPQNGEEEGI